MLFSFPTSDDSMNRKWSIKNKKKQKQSLAIFHFVLSARSKTTKRILIFESLNQKHFWIYFLTIFNHLKRVHMSFKIMLVNYVIYSNRIRLIVNAIIAYKKKSEKVFVNIFLIFNSKQLWFQSNRWNCKPWYTRQDVPSWRSLFPNLWCLEAHRHR